MELTPEEARFLLTILDNAKLTGTPSTLTQALAMLAGIRNKITASQEKPTEPATEK